MSVFLALLLLAQVGPVTAPGMDDPTQLPPEIVERKEREAAAPVVDQPEESRAVKLDISPDLAQCLVEANEDPLAAAEASREWFDASQGRERAEAGHCLGVALSRLERWEPAYVAFVASRDNSAPEDLAARARRGSMAGNAALASGDARAALDALELAETDARNSEQPDFAGEIALDKAQALVALGREEEAARSLAVARAALPESAQAWLLSATLSRRMGDLASAQTQIERAAELMPIAPDIGLEAGVIAVLSGRDEAARKSWQSVIDAAPESDAARVARGYIEQLEAS
ncbi:hypothetical protein GCM10011371_14300 [Novosphingobium marinum]|uniref:Tetratricopeptide (TPR) repeat protein n=1 Tax=Novosphingobium marinum TaxID=1514948 RepID=A0A7Y9XYD3_9SPHN|nr:hypothetical protein [Novosphingobium marinum]NYH95543.1 tetratricopeptide (TPR) repeat protein [Novosphingobium marinum]GGC27902.1 hypothetical protein GCM10011371_14300 [Novosphingobium marinum]